MNTSLKASAQQTPQQASSLSEREVVRLSLLQHLQKLVEADPKAAQNAMEASPEHAPGMYLIALNNSPRQFPQAILNSDSMHSLLSLYPEKAKAMMECESLQKLLEHLP